ncbi:MAG: sulfatase-like hydrolase/transferase [Planctomycetaceae bacterium]|jgi:arylsulfatase A-like enzyme|nr:sulfatase-like hydrolase/transferase [Planctomycetaceae bacterium]MDG2389962.1 sulfatase-like hydrolase/transferase [Planctomycetaceae bacterium]
MYPQRFYAFLILIVLFGSAWDLSAADKPNFLFLFADDQRDDTIAAYGNPHIDTPHIDSLVERAFSFERAYCMGSIHGAVCQPSRAMLMSGRTLYHVPMDLKNTALMPETLGNAGYRTFGTGKWHNGQKSFILGFQQGENVFFGGMSNHTKVPLKDVSTDGSVTDKGTDNGYSSELFADAAINFLESTPDDKPFFAYVSFTSPHDPRQPPKEYAKRYYKNLPPLPNNFLPQHPFFNGWMTGRDESLAAWPRTPNVVQQQLAEYYGMISHMDAQIGRILEALEKSGRADNTYIIYTADHGLAVGSHGLLGKQSVYEHSMGTPLMIAGPGIKKESSDALVYLLDLFPTITDLAGVETPKSVEGKSLAPIMNGEKNSVRETLYLTYEKYMRGLTDGRWKLIRYPHINYTQLFDLKSDPAELHNLAEMDEHTNRVIQMMEQLEEWQQKVDDKTPLTSAKPKNMEIDLSGRKRTPDRHQPKWIVEKYFGTD